MKRKLRSDSEQLDNNQVSTPDTPNTPKLLKSLKSNTIGSIYTKAKSNKYKNNSINILRVRLFYRKRS
jgi:hypothetical protein